MMLFILAMPQGYKHRSPHDLGAILFLSPVTTHFLIPCVTAFYASYYFLFPYYLGRKQIGRLLLFGLAVASICCLFAIGLSALVFGYQHWSTANDWISSVAAFIALTILMTIHSAIALVMRGFISWYGDIWWKDILRKKNDEMELNMIKSQMSPHFLFNTINNIDVLIQKDPTKASDYLNKLSHIMRFMLYETKSEKIPLGNEMIYIEKYIELQRIRTSNPDYVRLHISGNGEHHFIAPMLFIPFIENAFKHADGRKTGNSIAIRIVIDERMITFECENKYVENSVIDRAQGGLGNELIQKRLNLLYRGKHRLDVQSTNGIYKVQLTIESHEH